MSADFVKVRDTELLASDPRDLYRQKLARITLDSMVQFVGLLDAKGTVLEINHVALDAVGIKLADVEGRPFWTTFWWQVSEEINAALREYIHRASEGEFVRWDTPIYGRAGGKETIIIDASLMPVWDEDGKVVFIAAEGRDITEKKAYEREIARQREELAKLDELKTQFFANISHEFRTPLTLMLGPLEDAVADAAEPLGPHQEERISMVYRNGLRLQKLVNALLDFSRVEAGRIQASFQPVDLAALTTDLASSFRATCEKAGLTLAIDAPPLPQPVFIDQDMWEKIVLNLVSNAFKFTFDGEIRVGITDEGEHAVLHVSDTGTGIAEAELPRIFDRFHRVEGARGRTHEGTGIGLALVKQLIEIHKGDVSVESAVDVGTTVAVRVPFGTAHLPANRIETSQTLASTATRPEAFVSEALRWLPTSLSAEALSIEEEALGIAPVPAGERSRLLLADDNADMRDYLSRLLSAAYDVTAVANGEEALAAAGQARPDLILTDVMMPRLDGFGLLQALRADPELSALPVIVLSARAGKEAQLEGLRMGADDYLVKPFSARELLARVAANIDKARLYKSAQDEIGRRKQVEAALRESEQTLEAKVAERTAERDSMWKLTRDLMVVADAAGRWIAVNPAIEPMLGRPRIAYIGKTSQWIEHPEDIAKSRAEVDHLAKGGTTYSFENRLMHADGTYRWISWTAVSDADRIYASGRDLTAERDAAGELARAQEDLRQVQKMEAVGQLTGGIAHDFNNLLTIIMGNVEALQRHLPAEGPERLRRSAQNAMLGAQRAASLTHRLLAFSRRQPLNPKPLDCNKLVGSMGEMLTRTLGENIAIETVLAGGLWRTEADGNQLESALLNLAVNARDAMPDGGKLTIETANAHLDENYAARSAEVIPGQYVVIAVTDTGTGMTADVMERAFEPFFTTKPVGHGTGLGLPQVYGFVKQSGGHVKAYSEAGEGTSIKIYLPRLAGEAQDAEERAAVAIPDGHRSETVLVVEDEQMVRAYTSELLSELGYYVLQAHDGLSALAALDRNKVDLLFTDVGLPGMNGRQLADEAVKRRPGLKVLFTTGYARNAIVHHGRLDPGVRMIGKPFTYADLAAKIREALDRKE